MIERKIVEDKFTEYSISEFIRSEISDVPLEKVLFEKTPLGERITIVTSAPGLVIGKEGANIKHLTKSIKARFKFDNPQIKINEVEDQNLCSAIVAKVIANNLTKFGSQRFKLTGFKALSAVMNAGAMGVEIRLTGKLPSSRSKSWRFSKGYLKKTGYVSDFEIDKSIEHVVLKTGKIGIKVEIMRPETPLPDKITYFSQEKNTETVEKVEEAKKEVEEQWNF